MRKGRPWKDAGGKKKRGRPETLANVSEGLYELNADDRFQSDGLLSLDSSLGIDADREPTGDPDGASV